jgi:formate/nitrite transporter FocA (FNT family)
MAVAKSETPTTQVHLRNTFHLSVDEGVARLERSWTDLATTGLIGGMDVSLGVLAMLLLEHETGSRPLAALGFSVGLIAVTLGKSELFTENFLVPVAAVVAKKARPRALVRLWVGTLLTNLLGAWFLAWLLVAGAPEIELGAVRFSTVYADMDLQRAIALGLVGGMAMTFMTWMEHGSQSELGKIVSALIVAFLLAATPLNHVIVLSSEMFVALHSGAASFGYGTWARVAAIATVSNAIGGLLLVTTLRLAQVGRREIEKERHRPAEQAREEDAAVPSEKRG